jgi:protein-disulfide isomerase
MHDKLFQNSSAINPENISKWAREIGLDTTEFEESMRSGLYEGTIQKDMADAAAAKVMGTPTLFINGKRVRDRSFESLKKVIQEELATLRTSSAARRPS